VIFSDEKKFILDGPDGNTGYWRDLREQPRVFSRRNFGGGSLMVWGAYTACGTLRLAFPPTRMNSQEYQGVLASCLLPFLAEKAGELYVFQQDNASVHASKSTRAWLAERNIITLSWPACSPDLNPIENVWGILVHRVYEEGRQYGTIDELKVGVMEAWDSLENEVLARLSESMPARLFQVIHRNGDVTDY
jgi:hypothetical protein